MSGLINIMFIRTFKAFAAKGFGESVACNSERRRKRVSLNI